MKLQVNNSTWLNKSTIQVNNYKSIIQLELNRVKNPNWPEANQLAIYEDLSSGLPWTNPACGQGGTWSRGFQIVSPAL